VLSLCQDVVQLLRDVMSSSLCPCSSGHHLLQVRITVAAESGLVKSDMDVESTQSPVVSVPRRIAVAEQSSADDQLTQDDDDVDGSPWEIRLDPAVDKPPSQNFTSDGVPLLSEWNGKTSDGESSRHNVTRLDEAELVELIRRRVSLDKPLPQLLNRLLADRFWFTE